MFDTKVHSYVNGNSFVIISDDGTKVRYNYDGDIPFTPKPEFPESIDCKISNRCDMGCPMCHENSVPDGELADLSHPIFNSLHPYTELALGGGNVLEHPDLENFLQRMWEKRIICNMTLHLEHFLKNVDYVAELSNKGFVKGIGVSVNKPVDIGVIETLKRFPNLVVHTIAGIMPREGYEYLYDQGLKLLILGYKCYGRGNEYYDSNSDIFEKIAFLRQNLKDMIPHFKVISFDNNAIDQLNVKDIVSPEQWKKSYMGDDGQFTMYLDMVNKEFAKSSISERMSINGDKIEDLFRQVQNSRQKQGVI